MPKRRDITLKEVAQHNTPEDAWLALRGKVPSDSCVNRAAQQLQ